MADGRQRSDWQHTSSLMALVANAAFTRKGGGFSARDFDPFAPKVEPPKVSLKFIHEAMTEGKRKIKLTKRPDQEVPK